VNYLAVAADKPTAVAGVNLEPAERAQIGPNRKTLKNQPVYSKWNKSRCNNITETELQKKDSERCVLDHHVGCSGKG